MALLFDKVLVIGTGLIGGSLAKAMRERHLCTTVAGFGRNHQSLQLGVSLGVIDSVVEDLAAAVAESDLIVLGVPTLSITDYLPVIRQHRKPSCIVTDVASVKGEIAAALEQFFGTVPPWFILGHPIAGSEQSGIAASNANLYIQHKVILTPVASTDPSQLEQVAALWKAVGATVEQMGVEQHDTVLAATSHLPHALAYTLVDTLAGLDVNVDVFRFAAGGFRDFTRIASSHPVMWHDIMLANREAILRVIGEFQQHLDQLAEAIRQGDSEAILTLFERAKAARDQYAELLANQKKEDSPC